MASVHTFRKVQSAAEKREVARSLAGNVQEVEPDVPGAGRMQLWLKRPAG